MVLSKTADELNGCGQISVVRNENEVWGCAPARSVRVCDHVDLLGYN